MESVPPRPPRIRTLEIRRHSIVGEGEYSEVLCETGIWLARAEGALMRGRGFTHFLVTDSVRAVFTLAHFAAGMGSSTVSRFDVETAGMDEGAVAPWRQLLRKAQGSKDLRALLAADAPFVQKEAERLAATIGGRLMSYPADAKILAVFHSPGIELVTYGLTGEVVRPLDECEGVVLETDPHGTRLVREQRRQTYRLP